MGDRHGDLIVIEGAHDARLVFEAGGALSVLLVLLLGRVEHHLLDRLAHLARVPPEHHAVRAARERLRARLAAHPDHLVGRLAVAVLHRRRLHRLRALPRVPVGHLPVVAPTEQHVRILRVIFQADQRRRRL